MKSQGLDTIKLYLGGSQPRLVLLSTRYFQVSLMKTVVTQFAEPAHWCDLEDQVQHTLIHGYALSFLLAYDKAHCSCVYFGERRINSHHS